MFAENFKEWDRVHTCPSVSTPQQREEWTHLLCDAMVTYTEESKSDEEDIVVPLLIYLEDFGDKEDDPCESLSDPPSAEPTL